MQVVERKLFPVLRKALDEKRVLILGGMRGVGKTTAVKWLLDQVPSINKAYLDLGRWDQRLVFEQSNVEEACAFLRSLGLTLDQPLTIGLDGIPAGSKLSRVVKGMLDRFDIRFIIAGEQSFSLKSCFAASMAGVLASFELRPFDFGEFLDLRGVRVVKHDHWQEMQFNLQEYNWLNDLYGEYLSFGGMPAVVLEPQTAIKREKLYDLYASYLRIDVGSAADFRKLDELKLLLQVLPLRIGNKLDPNALSKIVGVSRPTLNEFLEFLENTGIITLFPAFAGPVREKAVGRKLYFSDNGFASILANPGESALFENAVFNQLRAYGVDSYYAGSGGSEIDFILAPTQSEPAALKVKYHPLQSDQQRLERFARKVEIPQAWTVGRYPTPGFDHFVWGGSIF